MLTGFAQTCCRCFELQLQIDSGTIGTCNKFFHKPQFSFIHKIAQLNCYKKSVLFMSKVKHKNKICKGSL